MNKETKATAIRVARTLVTNGSGIAASAAVSRSLHEKTDLESTEVAMISVYTLWGVRAFAEECFDLAVDIGSVVKARITAKTKPEQQKEDQQEEEQPEQAEKDDEVIDLLIEEEETVAPFPADDEEIETK